MAEEAGKSCLWVTGCVQNSVKHLPAIFDNIERLSSLFDCCEVMILENDSVDNTQSLLSDYSRSYVNVRFRMFGGLNERIPVKTLRLAALRNAAIDWLKFEGALLNPDDLVLILDLDEVNSEPWDMNIFAKVIDWFKFRADAAAVFANQLGPYYDLWALRHPEFCSDDIWWAVYQHHLAHQELSDQECLDDIYSPRKFSISPGHEPFQVESAFGGLGLYKAGWLARAALPYTGETTHLIATEEGGSRLLRWQMAEHVNFHAGLRAAGASLWIFPAWINWNTSRVVSMGGLRPNPSAWRHLEF